MTTTIRLRPASSLASNQGTIPAAKRAGDLYALAAGIASVTSPNERDDLKLAGDDRDDLARHLPHLAPVDRENRLCSIVAELHEAEKAEDLDPHDPDWRDPDDYRQSARATASDAVSADLAAGAR